MDANRTTELRPAGEGRHGAPPSNGRGEPPPPPVGGDDVGLDQLLAHVAGRRLLPGAEDARLRGAPGRRPPPWPPSRAGRPAWLGERRVWPPGSRESRPGRRTGRRRRAIAASAIPRG